MAEKPREERVSRRESLQVQKGQLKSDQGSLHLEIDMWAGCATAVQVGSLE